jgi:uncharacterized protein YuzE
MIRFEHDTVADAVYVRLATRPVARTGELDSQRTVDYDKRDEVIGIEFLAVSRGVDLRNLPYRAELEQYFREHHIPLFA